MLKYTCGLLTVSDSTFYGDSADLSGKILSEEINKLKMFEKIHKSVVPDEVEAIKSSLIKWSDENKLNLILTTGGTGLTSRDVTPEATKSVLDRKAPSISQAMLTESLTVTKFAMLSRGVSGIRKCTLIINLPGSPKAVKECITYLSPVLTHALDQLSDRKEVVKDYHKRMQAKQTTCVPTLPRDVMLRPRKSPYPLFSVPRALEIILSSTQKCPPVVLSLEESFAMVTSEVVLSEINVPPFAASIKDGYAVRFEDGAGVREVVSVSNAGDDEVHNIETSVMSGTCVRISTGAPVPRGADSVVQVEDTDLIENSENQDKETSVNIRVGPKHIGQDIRPVGNDLRVGDVLVKEGVMLSPCEVGLLAMGGLARVSVIKRPTVGVLSTGNELVSYSDDSINPRRIVDCNRPLLMSLYRSVAVTVIDLGIVQDEPQAILDVLKSAITRCDVIVTTGGVSMGEKDYLKSVLVNDLKAEIHFGRVLMKPGKPTTFSSLCNEYTEGQKKLIFSLPGNPVSAFVTSHLFVVPCLKKMAGLCDYENVPVMAKLRHEVVLDDRPDFRRCTLWMVEYVGGEGFGYEVSCQEFGSQMSSRLCSCVAANGLLCLPQMSEVSSASLDAGSMVPVLRI